MTLTVSDIMTTDLVKLTREASLQDAHNITRKKGIRHLPVVEQETGKLLAIVTQKNMIAKVISALTLYGGSALAEQETRTGIMEVAVTDYDTVDRNQPLVDIAPFFLRNKHGCLPVVDEQARLVGIITSSDFVKLSVQLLQERENS